MFRLALAVLALALVPAAPAAAGVLTVGSAGPGAGTVTSDPPGIACPPDCSADFPEGTQVALRPRGDAHSYWDWEDSLSTCELEGLVHQLCRLTVFGDRSIAFTFGRLRTITVVRTGSGGGVVRTDDGRVECGDRCTTTVAEGDTIHLETAAPPGTHVVSWSEPECEPHALECNLTADRDRTVTVVFSAVRYVVYRAVGQGAIFNDHGAECTHLCIVGADDGDVFRGEAVPFGKGAVFLGWSGSCAGSGPVCEIAVDGDELLEAHFSTPALGGLPGPALRATVTARRARLRTVARRGLPVRVGCTAACRARVALYLPHRRRAAARATVDVPAGAGRHLVLRLTPAAKRQLPRRGGAAVVRVRAVDAAGAVGTVSTRVRLRR